MTVACVATELPRTDGVGACDRDISFASRVFPSRTRGVIAFDLCDNGRGTLLLFHRSGLRVSIESVGAGVVCIGGQRLALADSEAVASAAVRLFTWNAEWGSVLDIERRIRREIAPSIHRWCRQQQAKWPRSSEVHRGALRALRSVPPWTLDSKFLDVVDDELLAQLRASGAPWAVLSRELDGAEVRWGTDLFAEATERARRWSVWFGPKGGDGVSLVGIAAAWPRCFSARWLGHLRWAAFRAAPRCPLEAVVRGLLPMHPAFETSLALRGHPCADAVRTAHAVEIGRAMGLLAHARPQWRLSQRDLFAIDRVAAFSLRSRVLAGLRLPALVETALEEALCKENS